MTPESGAASPEPGAALQIAMTKWVDSPHWTLPACYLGRDSFGTWLGHRAGDVHRRPGVEVTLQCDAVGLVPEDAWHVATFYSRPAGCPQVYVDVATVPTWRDHETIGAVDLDLDVIRRWDGNVYVDDEDEFDEHRTSLRYPDEIVAGARASCASLVRQVGAAEGAFAPEVAAGWLDRLRALG